MRKNRYIICLIAALAMLVFALPELPLREQGLGGVYSIAWVVFCLFVIAGNLAALLYLPSKSPSPGKVEKQGRKSQRMYEYERK